MYRAQSWTSSAQHTAIEHNFCPALMIEHIEQCFFFVMILSCLNFFGARVVCSRKLIWGRSRYSQIPSLSRLDGCVIRCYKEWMKHVLKSSYPVKSSCVQTDDRSEQLPTGRLRKFGLIGGSSVVDIVAGADCVRRRRLSEELESHARRLIDVVDGFADDMDGTGGSWPRTSAIRSSPSWADMS